MSGRESHYTELLEEEYAIAAGSPFTVGSREERLDPSDLKYLRRAGLGANDVAHIAGETKPNNKALEWHHRLP